MRFSDDASALGFSDPLPSTGQRQVSKWDSGDRMKDIWNSAAVSVPPYCSRPQLERPEQGSEHFVGAGNQSPRVLRDTGEETVLSVVLRMGLKVLEVVRPTHRPTHEVSVPLTPILGKESEVWAATPASMTPASPNAHTLSYPLNSCLPSPQSNHPRPYSAKGQVPRL